MTDPRAALLAEARRRHPDLTPCASRATLEDSFTTLPSGELVLWWNDETGSTRVLRESAMAPDGAAVNT